MKGTTYIDISEALHLEIEYNYTPEISSADYDVPPDPEELGVEEVYLCGIVDLGGGKNSWVRINIFSEWEDLASELDWDNIRDKALKHAKES